MTKIIQLTPDDSRLLKNIQDMAHPSYHGAEANLLGESNLQSDLIE